MRRELSDAAASDEDLEQQRRPRREDTSTQPAHTLRTTAPANGGVTGSVFNRVSVARCPASDSGSEPASSRAPSEQPGAGAISVRMGVAAPIIKAQKNVFAPQMATRPAPAQHVARRPGDTTPAWPKPTSETAKPVSRALTSSLNNWTDDQLESDAARALEARFGGMGI